MSDLKFHGFDYLVIGCGLSGSVIARELADKTDKHVLIIEKRNHVCGNLFDFVDSYGVLVHKFGPHIFHTNNQEVYNYINQFCEWEKYELICGANIDGKDVPTPFNFETIDEFYTPKHADKLKQKLLSYYKGKKRITILDAIHCPDNDIKEYALFLYNNDFKLYSAKQWGLAPEEINPSIFSRVPLLLSYDRGYFDDTYQIMPKKSYSDLFVNLLDSNLIKIELNCNALEFLSIDYNHRNLLWHNEVISVPVFFTGPVDELFHYKYGKLSYRTLSFEWHHCNQTSFQNFPVIAYPQEKSFTRITEYKKLTKQIINGSSYAIEYPQSYCSESNDEPYYPVLTEQTSNIYSQYHCLADSFLNLRLVGRLASFKYLNMDQAISNSLSCVRDLLKLRSCLN